MTEFGLQLFSIRDHFQTEEDIKEAFLEMKKYGYSYGQTAGTYDFITPERYAELAREAGITICGTHYNWDRIVNDVEGTVKYHQILGTTNVGIGGMPENARHTKEDLLAFIDLFNETAEKYAKYGMKLTYHNHSFEFRKFDGKTIFDYLVEGFNPETTSFVLDTYWVQHGGADVRATIERLAGRIDILHMKDMEAFYPYPSADGKFVYAPHIIEVGEGNINFRDILPLAERCGVKYFVVEDDRAPSVGSYEAIKKSADYIKANLLNL